MGSGILLPQQQSIPANRSAAVDQQTVSTDHSTNVAKRSAALMEPTMLAAAKRQKIQPRRLRTAKTRLATFARRPDTNSWPRAPRRRRCPLDQKVDLDVRLAKVRARQVDVASRTEAIVKGASSHSEDSHERYWEQLQESASRATPPWASEMLDKESSSAIGDANTSSWPDSERRLRNAILLENREPGACVAAVGIVLEDVAVESERQDRKVPKLL